MSRARREAVLKQAVEGTTADGVYKGINNYIDYTAVRAVTSALGVCLEGRCLIHKHQVCRRLQARLAPAACQAVNCSFLPVHMLCVCV